VRRPGPGLGSRGRGQLLPALPHLVRRPDGRRGGGLRAPRATAGRATGGPVLRRQAKTKYGTAGFKARRRSGRPRQGERAPAGARGPRPNLTGRHFCYAGRRGPFVGGGRTFRSGSGASGQKDQQWKELPSSRWGRNAPEAHEATPAGRTRATAATRAPARGKATRLPRLMRARRPRPAARAPPRTAGTAAPRPSSGQNDYATSSRTRASSGHQRSSSIGGDTGERPRTANRPGEMTEYREDFRDRMVAQTIGSRRPFSLLTCAYCSNLALCIPASVRGFTGQMSYGIVRARRCCGAARGRKPLWIDTVLSVNDTRATPPAGPLGSLCSRNKRNDQRPAGNGRATTPTACSTGP
jgi:hypothetical protein